MKYASEVIDSEIKKELMLRKKALLTKIILPSLLITTIFLVISHWRFDEKILWGMLLLVLIVSANIFLSMENRVIKTPWGTLESRSDGMDTLRWCITLVLDIVLIWSLEIEVASVVAAWLLVTVGAMADIQEQKNKLIAVGTAFIVFCILIIFIYPTELKTQIYLISCYTALVFAFWKLEGFLVNEMTSYFMETLYRKEVEKEALELQREAAIGHSTRAINHEMNTLISTALLTTDKLKDTLGSDSKELIRLDKALSYMSKVSLLVLDDISGQHTTTTRKVSLQQLYEDTYLLLCRNYEKCLTSVNIDFPNNPDVYTFKERTGSTYLIIHNLVKNAHETIYEKYRDQIGGKIEISAHIDNDKITIAITDNGVGIPAKKLAKINNGDQLSTKEYGHGLGLLFVREECKNNGFKLNIDSKLEQGSKFSVILN